MSIKTLAREIKSAGREIAKDNIHKDYCLTCSKDTITVTSDSGFESIAVGNLYEGKYMYMYYDNTDKRNSYPAQKLIEILLQKLADREKLEGDYVSYHYDEDKIDEDDFLVYISNIVRTMAGIQNQYIDDDSLKYLGNYITMTPAIIKKIVKHAEKYNIKPEICAYYYDWKDFCSDWCDEHGYSKSEAKELFHSEDGEFMTLPDKLGMIRFVI